MKTKKKPLLFRIIQRIVRSLYLKYEVEIQEPIRTEAAVFVSNHAQIHGPLASYLYFPFPKKVWVIGEMCHIKEVPSYAMQDFWRYKPKITKWFWWLFSVFIVAPLGSYLMSRADTVPVYRDARLKLTLQKTIETLDNNVNIVIFPEGKEPYNRYINAFQKHFVDVARHYVRRTKKQISFYPMYICRDFKKIIIGKPIMYQPEQEMESERNRIVHYLQEQISALGDALPNHVIVPYENINKKNRPHSKEE